MTSTSHPTDGDWRSRFRRSAAARRCNWSTWIRCVRGACRAPDAARFRGLGAGEFRVLARWSLPVRQLVLHRCFEHLSLRLRARLDGGDEQLRHRVLPAAASGGRLTHRLSIHGRRFRDRCGSKRSRSRTWLRSRSSANKCAEKYPVVESWNVGSPAKIRIDSLTQYAGPYRNLRSIGLESIYPIVEGYKNSGAMGLRATLSDPGFWNTIDLTVSYSPATELSPRRTTARQRRLATSAVGAAPLQIQ